MDQPSGSGEAAPRMPNPRCGYSSWAASSHPTATIKNHLKNSIKELKIPHLNFKKTQAVGVLYWLHCLEARNRKKVNSTSHTNELLTFLLSPRTTSYRGTYAAPIRASRNHHAENERIHRSWISKSKNKCSPCSASAGKYQMMLPPATLSRSFDVEN